MSGASSESWGYKVKWLRNFFLPICGPGLHPWHGRQGRGGEGGNIPGGHCCNGESRNQKSKFEKSSRVNLEDQPKKRSDKNLTHFV